MRKQQDSIKKTEATQFEFQTTFIANANDTIRVT